MNKCRLMQENFIGNCEGVVTTDTPHEALVREVSLVEINVSIREPG
jgi:hypothetical protein